MPVSGVQARPKLVGCRAFLVRSARASRCPCHPGQEFATLSSCAPQVSPTLDRLVPRERPHAHRAPGHRTGRERAGLVLVAFDAPAARAGLPAAADPAVRARIVSVPARCLWTRDLGGRVPAVPGLL